MKETTTEAPFIFTVRQLTRYIKALVERDRGLQAVWVRGEISDLTLHSSGHLYFTLKDEHSRLRCAMFRSEVATLAFQPEIGMKVLANGRIGVYEPMGQYQMIVEELAAEGAGALFLAFEALKKKLAAEGFFDEARKRPLPPYPSRVALLTSPDGAVLHDLVTVIRRRRPQIDLLLIPIPVQGAVAAKGIIHALELLEGLEGIDLAILARGGGSPEELAGFNDEGVARAIAASPVPVVSAVGHEVDFTIADFVADVRAATPSAAAELVAADNRQLRSSLSHLDSRRAAALSRKLEAARRELRHLMEQRVFRFPLEIVSVRAQQFDAVTEELQAAMSTHLREAAQTLRELEGKLQALSPLGILQRGYAVVRKLPEGKVVRAVKELSAGDKAQIQLADGSAQAEIESLQKDDDSAESA